MTSKEAFLKKKLDTYERVVREIEHLPSLDHGAKTKIERLNQWIFAMEQKAREEAVAHG